MSPGPLSRKRCTTVGTASRLWVVAALVLAMTGFAGFVAADGGNAPAMAPLSKARPGGPGIVVVSEDADGNATSTAIEPNSRSVGSPLAPSNDDCSGAIPIPTASFPVVTAPVNITDAQPQGSDDPVFGCATTDQTIWYSFTPAVTGLYTFQTCGSVATGSTVYDTVLAVLASTGGSCPSGGSLGCNDTGAACAATLPDAPYVDQSKLSAVLSAGTTYFVVAGHWSGDAGGVVPGMDTIAIRVDLSPAPPNDTCANPTVLPLNRIVQGTTAGAANNYQSPDDFACYSGLAQIRSTAPGRDVVFRFTAPADGTYSFRHVMDDSSAALRTQNPVLYASSSCPTGGVVSCLKGANRMVPATGQNRSEEINCLPLTAGQVIYVFFDDAASGTANDGGEFQFEATQCQPEVEPNDTQAQAGAPACYTTGGTGAVGDVDWFSLGAPPAGGRVFAALDSVQAGQQDWELRVTTATDTLQYDDNDGASIVGSNSPLIGGTPTTGDPLFLRVNHKTAGSPNETYHLYAVVRSGDPQMEFDDQSDGLGNGSFATANPISAGGYILGSSLDGNDFDCYAFIANEGDDLMLMTDNNPYRTAGGVNNAWPILYGTSGNAVPFRTRFTGQITRNILTPSPGTLTGLTPSIVSEFWAVRARYTGAYFVCYLPDGVGGASGASGTPPWPYAGSVAANCGPLRNSSTYNTDVSITKSGPTGPTSVGDLVTYTINVTNNGNDIAHMVRMVESLPPELFYESLSVNDGWDGNNTECYSLPTAGTNADAAIDCTNFAINPGQTVVWTLTARIQPCITAGTTISNTASITSASTDPDSSNNSATWNFDGPTVVDGVCTDENQCTNADHCEGFVCVGTPSTDPCSDGSECTLNDTCGTDANGVPACIGGPAPDCNDNSVCTTDFCVPAVPGGCVNDPGPGLSCDDGVPCTSDECDPVSGCFFPPSPAGTPCNDFATCTVNDGCDGAGSCVGTSVCDDGNGCTDDYADEFNNCFCEYLPSFEGTPCNDGNACLLGDVCDGFSLCVSGTEVPNCDDNNPCTNDSCDPAVGCVNALVVCDDNNACTTDSCDPAVGCVFAPIVCDDGNACTVDGCDPASGCFTTPVNCDDGNACTTDSCDPASGCYYGVVNCDDGECCTIDSCNPATGCVYTPNTTAPVFTAQPSLGVCAMLWPPNHGYADFSVADTGASASSACGIAAIQFASCSSSQPENTTGVGDGNTMRDCVYEPGAAHLRAERDGACSPVGRDYALTLVAVDVCGNATASNPFNVGVWHDRGNPPVPGGTVYQGNGGTNDTRPGMNGTYGAGCGAGNPACGEAGQPADTSDADPEMEIGQQASISVGDLRLEKSSGGNVNLRWTEPAHHPQINVTRFHVYRLDPTTLFWTKIAEVTKQTTTYMDPVMNDGGNHMYKVTAVIK